LVDRTFVGRGDERDRLVGLDGPVADVDRTADGVNQRPGALYPKVLLMDGGPAGGGSWVLELVAATRTDPATIALTAAAAVPATR